MPPYWTPRAICSQSTSQLESNASSECSPHQTSTPMRTMAKAWRRSSRPTGYSSASRSESVPSDRNLFPMPSLYGWAFVFSSPQSPLPLAIVVHRGSYYRCYRGSHSGGNCRNLAGWVTSTPHRPGCSDRRSSIGGLASAPAPWNGHACPISWPDRKVVEALVDARSPDGDIGAVDVDGDG